MNVEAACRRHLEEREEMPDMEQRAILPAAREQAVAAAPLAIEAPPVVLALPAPPRRLAIEARPVLPHAVLVTPPPFVPPVDGPEHGQRREPGNDGRVPNIIVVDEQGNEHEVPPPLARDRLIYDEMRTYLTMR